jgi:hypothetical protein
MKGSHLFWLSRSKGMKGSHRFWLSRSKGMTVDILIRDYDPPRCFQKKISGSGKHNALGQNLQT